jgi:hypothetical protein
MTRLDHEAVRGGVYDAVAEALDYRRLPLTATEFHDTFEKGVRAGVEAALTGDDERFYDAVTKGVRLGVVEYLIGDSITLENGVRSAVSEYLASNGLPGAS